jgi:hypothetical protein
MLKNLKIYKKINFKQKQNPKFSEICDSKQPLNLIIVFLDMMV